LEEEKEKLDNANGTKRNETEGVYNQISGIQYYKTAVPNTLV